MKDEKNIKDNNFKILKNLAAIRKEK